jgi:hypothetical protein
MNVVPHVRKHTSAPAKLRALRPVRVPFSVSGMAVVLACPALLLVDIASGMHAMIGILYLVMLMMLGNERRTLIALFTTIAVLMLAIDLRVFYGASVAELAAADKIIALIVLPVLAFALIRQRTQERKAAKRKAICSIRVMLPVSERAALSGESKIVFKHMRHSTEPMDEYTRELIWFMYMKSAKN